MISREKLLVPILLGCLCLLLCAVIILITRPNAIDTATPSPTLQPVSMPQDYLPTPSNLRQANLRPLFDPARRPPEPAVPQASGAIDTVSALEMHDLTAIIRNARGAQVFVKAPDEMESGQWLQVGDGYEGWTLQSIGRDSATFMARGRETTLFLFPGQKADEDRSE